MRLNLFSTLFFLLFLVSCEQLVGPIPDKPKEEAIPRSLDIKQATLIIAPNTGSYSFGSFVAGSSSAIVSFTIENIGNTTINLSPATLTAGNITNFNLDTGAQASTLTPGQTTDFKIQFISSAGDLPGVKSATVNLASSDPALPSYRFIAKADLTATPEPEIEISLYGTVVNNGDNPFTDYGGVTAGSSEVLTFTIKNMGTADLTLNSPTISGDTADFSFTSLPSILTPGTSANFDIIFTPTSSGNKYFTITIPNNDSDESNFSFGVYGVGMAPEIEVYINSFPVVSGDPFVFPSTTIGLSAIANIQIKNMGNAPLNISSIINTNNTEYSLVYTGLAPIGPGGTFDFTLEFSPTEIMSFTDDLTIISDDADEGNFTIHFSGDGL